MTYSKVEPLAGSGAFMRKLFPVGSVAYTVTVDVSPNGMNRSIKVLAMVQGVIVNVSRDVAGILNWKYDFNRGAIRVQGTGMNMPAHIIYTLSRNLHGFSGIQHQSL